MLEKILFLLISLSILVVIGLVGLFWWSIRTGQYEDLEGPAYQILDDDDVKDQEVSASKNTAQHVMKQSQD